MRCAKFGIRRHVQGHFLSNVALVQFRLDRIRRHIRQGLVYVVYQPVSSVVIPSFDRTARQEIFRVVFAKEERSVGLSDVVPTVRVLYLHQPAFPLAVQAYASRQGRDVSSQRVDGMYLHRRIAR